MVGRRKQGKINCLRNLCERKNITVHPEIDDLSTTELAKEILRVRALPR